MNIEKGNKLIKDFMNSEISPKDYTLLIVAINGNYHKSWDWLMPVLEKIEKLDNVYSIDIEIGGAVSIFSDKTFESIIGGIESAWKVTVKFIKWYNKTK